MTYDAAGKFLGKRETKSMGKVATTMRKEGSDFVIRYHNTDVVTIHPDGTYTLRAGGWLTPTTKTRLNDYSPAHIFQEKGMLYIMANTKAEDVWAKSNKVMFEEGMNVGSDGSPLSVTEGLQKAVERAKRRVDNLVRAYIKGFMADLAENGLRDPSGGDCWLCNIAAQNADVSGVDHYFSHFEEGYYVPSLLWDAVNKAGHGNSSLVWGMIQCDLGHGRSSGLAEGDLRSFFRKLKPALVEYLMQQQQVEAAA